MKLTEYREKMKTILLTRNSMIRLAKDNYSKARRDLNAKYMRELKK